MNRIRRINFLKLRDVLKNKLRRGEESFSMNKVIFLDRDGTINEDVGDFCSLDKLKFIPKSLEALKILQDLGFLLIIVTNQTGINKKIFTEEEFLKFNKEYLKILSDNNVEIKKVFYCPHLKEENCICRKPKTYFIEIAKQKYNIDIENSYTIGDHPHDIEMGFESKAKTIYLLSGHGKKHIKELTVKPNYIAENLYDAALWIKKTSNL